MTEKELIEKADLALSDLISSGGYMQPEQAQTFIRLMIDEPTILRDCRVVPMRRPKMEINKVGFSSRILAAANQGTISTPELGDVGTRALAANLRAKPTLQRITLETQEIIAEIDLPYEVLEDNIEGGQIDATQFEQTIIELIAQRAALDLEELLISGDTSSSDSYLALFNGILAQATVNTVNWGNAEVSPQLFANMMKSMPTKYHRLFGQMRHYFSKIKEIDYRSQVAQRQTSLGDATLEGTRDVSVLGIPMRGVALMPNANGILTVPRNIIWGVQRDIRMEYARDIRERVIYVVLTMRIATQFEQQDMVVQALNVG